MVGRVDSFSFGSAVVNENDNVCPHPATPPSLLFLPLPFLRRSFETLDNQEKMVVNIHSFNKSQIPGVVSRER